MPSINDFTETSTRAAPLRKRARLLRRSASRNCECSTASSAAGTNAAISFGQRLCFEHAFVKQNHAAPDGFRVCIAHELRRDDVARSRLVQQVLALTRQRDVRAGEFADRVREPGEALRAARFGAEAFQIFLDVVDLMRELVVRGPLRRSERYAVMVDRIRGQPARFARILEAEAIDDRAERLRHDLFVEAQRLAVRVQLVALGRRRKPEPIRRARGEHVAKRFGSGAMTLIDHEHDRRRLPRNERGQLHRRRIDHGNQRVVRPERIAAARAPACRCAPQRSWCAAR